MRISDWSSDVCSSDLSAIEAAPGAAEPPRPAVAKQSPRPHGQPSLVVMPFDDLGGDNDDFFADGVVEEITAALSRIKDFFVIARQSARSEEHTSELQSLMRTSYAVFCLKKTNNPSYI